MSFEIGDRVKMVNCFEAKLYPNKVWVVRSDPWLLGSGILVVLLKGKTGGFACDCLRKAPPSSNLWYRGTDGLYHWHKIPDCGTLTLFDDSAETSALLPSECCFICLMACFDEIICMPFNPPEVTA